MERLTKHLLSLLRRHDKVALPGIGYFKIEQISARYDCESSQFFPPYYSLAFEITYITEDSLLLESYERKGRTGKEEVWKLMKRDLDHFLDTLEADEEVVLPGLGTFIYKEDEIDFHPSFSLNVSLPTIEVQPFAEAVRAIAEEESEEEKRMAEEMQLVPASETETQPAAEREIQQIPEAALENVESTIENEKAELPEASEQENTEREAEDGPYRIPEGYHYHKPEYLYIPIRKTIAKIAASLILVVIVGLTAILPHSSCNNPSSTASILPIEVREQKGRSEASDTAKAAPADTVKEEKAEQTYKRPLLATTDEGEVVPGANSLSTTPYLQDDTPLKKYYAVVAALRTNKEVERFVEANKEEIHKYKIIRNKKISLVTVSSANDRQELENQMPLIRAEYPKAWIFTLK